MKYFWIACCLLGIIGLSLWLYKQALIQPNYEGLPTVACLDYTKPIVQKFSLHLSIYIHGKLFPLDPGIGHDYGNCLHDIFVNDSSGKVNIRANDDETFILGQFFDEWHKTFSQHQLFGYLTENDMKILVNGKQVYTYRATILHTGDTIEVFYE